MSQFPLTNREFAELYTASYNLAQMLKFAEDAMSFSLDTRRAREVDGSTVTLMHQRSSIEAQLWLMGECQTAAQTVWQLTEKLEENME